VYYLFNFWSDFHNLTFFSTIIFMDSTTLLNEGAIVFEDYRIKIYFKWNLKDRILYNQQFIFFREKFIQIFYHSLAE